MSLVSDTASNVATGRRSAFIPGLDGLVALLLLLVPALVLVVDRGGSVPLGLLFLIGSVVAVRRRSWRHLGRVEWWLIGAVLLYCVASLLGAWQGEWNDIAITKMKKHLRLLQFVPVYLLLRELRPSEGWLWSGLLAGAVGAGGVAVYEVVVLGLPRAAGANNVIHFGNISALLGMASLGALGWAKVRGLSLLPWLALSLGLLASLLSGTRGAWLAIPVGLLAALIHLWPQFGGRARLVLLLLPPLLFSAAYLTPQTGVAMRIDQAVANLTAYEPGEQGHKPTSLGVRLDGWLLSSRLIAEHPWLGVGIGRYREVAAPFVERGEASEGVLVYDHPHNAWINTQLTRGLSGGVSLLLLIGIPAVVGLRALLGRHAGERAHGYALLVISAGYATHAIPNNIFERGLSISFFVFAIASCMAGVYNARAAEASPEGA